MLSALVTPIRQRKGSLVIDCSVRRCGCQYVASLGRILENVLWFIVLFPAVKSEPAVRACCVVVGFGRRCVFPTSINKLVHALLAKVRVHLISRGRNNSPASSCISSPAWHRVAIALQMSLYAPPPCLSLQDERSRTLPPRFPLPRRLPSRMTWSA